MFHFIRTIGCNASDASSTKKGGKLTFHREIEFKFIEFIKFHNSHTNCLQIKSFDALWTCILNGQHIEFARNNRLTILNRKLEYRYIYITFLWLDSTPKGLTLQCIWQKNKLSLFSFGHVLCWRVNFTYIAYTIDCK